MRGTPAEFAVRPPDRLQAPEEEYKFDQSGAGLTIADQPAEIQRSSRAASCVRSENSGSVQTIVNSLDLTQKARPPLSISGQNYTLDKVKRIIRPTT